VAEHKVKEVSSILVTPVEFLGYFDGEIKQDPDFMEIKGKDVDGKEYEKRLETDNVYHAEWLQLASNRATAPDVRKGERVMIWKHSDANKYYWQCLGMDDNLRKQETILLEISAKSADDDHTLTKDNTYFLEISSHNKMITFSTSQDMGEPFAYIGQLNTGEGYFHLHDDVGNEILLDSTNTHIKLYNKDTTLVELNKKDINMYAPKDINGLADERVMIEAGKMLQLKVGDERLVMEPGKTRVYTSDYEAIKV
jgi:hypothetical protein